MWAVGAAGMLVQWADLCAAAAAASAAAAARAGLKSADMKGGQWRALEGALRELYLQDNRLQAAPPTGLLLQLVVLDLSYNELCELQMRAFASGSSCPVESSRRRAP